MNLTLHCGDKEAKEVAAAQQNSDVMDLLQAGRTPSQVTKAPDTKVRLTAQPRAYFSHKQNAGTMHLLLESKDQ